LYLGYYILVVSVSGVFDIAGKRERRGRLREEGMVFIGKGLSFFGGGNEGIREGFVCGFLLSSLVLFFSLLS